MRPNPHTPHQVTLHTHTCMHIHNQQVAGDMRTLQLVKELM